MTKYGMKWKDLAELIGIVAIVASLFFVGMQLKRSTLIAETETASQEMQSTLEAHSQINEHSGIWVRGLSGGELSEVDAVVFENLLINLNDVAFNASSNYAALGNELSANIVITHFAGFLYQNPGARRVWESRENRLGGFREKLGLELSEDGLDFTKLTLEALDTLDSNTN